MKRGLTQKQLLKGIKHLEHKSDYLHFSIEYYLRYKKDTKNIAMSFVVQDELKRLYSDIIEAREDLSQLQRKYL